MKLQDCGQNSMAKQADSERMDQITEEDSTKSEIMKNNWVIAEVFEKGTPDIEKRLLNYAFNIINEAPDSEYAVQHILQEIGMFYNLSRIDIYMNNLGFANPKVEYEWLNSGVPSITDYEIKESKLLTEAYNKLFQKNGVFFYHDMEEVKSEPILKEYYLKLGTKAMVQCAIFDSEDFIGVISYKDCTNPRKWKKKEIETLFTLTKLIGNYLIKQMSKQLLGNEVFFNQATLNTQKLSNYAVIEGTYLLFYFSDYTKTMFPGAKLGELCYQSLYRKDKPCSDCPIQGLNEENKVYSVDAYDKNKDVWYTTTSSSISMSNGRRLQLICSSDVTGFMERVTSKDNMTGLLTFTRFEVEAMKILNSSNTKYMVLYTDFDKFKNINDEWGYSIGNEILISYAELGSRYLKSDELFCRITADKFILFLSYKTKKEVLERIDKAYIEIAGGIRKNYPKITTVVIGGIYFLKPEDKNISLAVDKANIARKTIKGNHRSHFVIYDEFLHRQVTKENGVASKMREALRNNEFIVYMQPKVDLATAKIIGAEALVRWRVPSGEILGAHEFIPIFEKNGFITELDFYVYDKTMKALRQWLDMGKQEIVVSLNVSRLHLKEARLIEYLDHLLKKYQIPSRLIELEITENMFFAEIDRLKNIIDILRNYGFLISIDDFGSGYSSLNLLKTLPIDILKLDREFFMENHMGDHDKIIISSIISLAKGLGLKVISEGVETKEQLEFLKESCCDMAQGYLFYKPMPMEEFVILLD